MILQFKNVFDLDDLSYKSLKSDFMAWAEGPGKECAYTALIAHPDVVLNFFHKIKKVDGRLELPLPHDLVRYLYGDDFGFDDSSIAVVDAVGFPSRDLVVFNSWTSEQFSVQFIEFQNRYNPFNNIKMDWSRSHDTRTKKYSSLFWSLISE